jgi:hypothetical protein
VREAIAMRPSGRAASARMRAAGGPERFADAAEELIDPARRGRADQSLRGSVRSISV